MKNFSKIFIILTVISSSCSEKKPVAFEEKYVEPHYDTTAIDSFSEGAISVDVANQIRRSSIAYQDSLKEVAAQIEKTKMEQEIKAKETDAKATSDKKEKEKTANDEAKKAEVKKSADQPQPQQTNPTN